MTDAPSPSPSSSSGVFRQAFRHLSGSSLAARAAMLVVLTLLLKIPLGMVGGVVADRQSYESEAVNNVQDSWGRAQTFVGPMVFLPYKPANSTWTRALTLLPDRLAIDGNVMPSQRRRGLFAVTVYTASLDVVAEFQTK